MWKWIVGVAALTLGAALFLFLGNNDSGLEHAKYGTVNEVARGSSAMCPWRDSKRDMAILFPGADSYRLDTVILSRHKIAIQKRLGSAYHMDTTALYVYRIQRGSQAVGSVGVKRAAGPHGAIEIVAAVDSGGRIAGVLVQRLREPESITRSLTDPKWLSRFKGMTAANAETWPVPELPSASEPARTAVIFALKSLLVEMAESDPQLARQVNIADHRR